MEIKYNNQSGQLGAPISTAPAAGTSETWPNLFAVAPKFATLAAGDWITFVVEWLPNSFGINSPRFEIMYLTAYTEGEVSGTVTRAAEDSVNWPPVSHANAVPWGCNPTTADYPALSATTKRVTMPLNANAGTGDVSGISDFVSRHGIVLPVTTTRWRIRAANPVNVQAGGFAAGAITLTNIYIGTPLLSDLGAWPGAFTTTPVEAAAGGTFNGTEFFSAWVTDPALQIQADQLAGISWGFTCAGGQVIATANGIPSGITFFGAGSAAQAGHVGVPTTTNSGGTAQLDVRIEYECVTSLPVVVVIGDSTAAGFIDDSHLFPQIPGPTYTWPCQAMLKNRFLVANAGIPSAQYATDFAESTWWSFARFDLVTTVPDVMILASGINEALNSLNPEQFGIDMIVTQDILKAKGINRTYVTTVMAQPRIAFSGGILTQPATAGDMTIQTSWLYADTNGVNINPYGDASETVIVSGTPTGGGPYTTTLASPIEQSYPAGVATGFNPEAQRQGINSYLRGLPSGAEGVFDFDWALPWYSPLAIWWGTDPTQIHPGTGAYALFGSLVQIRSS